jgi:hypothetical protein
VAVQPFESSGPRGVSPRAGIQLQSAEVLGWLVFYVVALTLTHEISHGAGNLHNDTLESYAWGKELQLGYSKHPPFWAWVACGWFAIFPATDWAAYLLSSVNSAVGLACSWLIARRYMSAERATCTMLCLMLTPMDLCFAQRFNANTVLLSLWPATTLAALRLVDRRRLADGVLAGLLIGLCLLSKYQSVLFLAPLALSVYLTSDAAPYLSRAAFVCYTVAAATILPHALWLTRHDFLPLVYAEVTTGRPFPVVLREALIFLLVSAAYLAPAVLGYAWAAGWNLRQLARALTNAMAGERRTVAVLAFGTLFLTLAVCLVRSSTVKPSYATPMFFALPIWLALAPGLPFASCGLRRLRVLGAVAIFGSLALAPAVGFITFASQARLAIRPKAEIVRAVTAEWHRRFALPLGIVAGDEDYAIAAPFYSSDHPSYLVGLDRRVLNDFAIPLGGGMTDLVLRQSPWVSRDRIAHEGLAIVCSDEHWLTSTGCNREAARWARPGATEFELAVAKEFLGWRGPVYKFHVYFLPPEASR